MESLLIAGVVGALGYKVYNSGPNWSGTAFVSPHAYEVIEGGIQPHIYNKQILANEVGYPVDLFQREEQLNLAVPAGVGSTPEERQAVLGGFIDNLRLLVLQREQIAEGVWQEALRQRAQTHPNDRENQFKLLPGALSDITRDPRWQAYYSRYHGQVAGPN